MRFRNTVITAVFVLALWTCAYSQTPAAMERGLATDLDVISATGNYGGNSDEAKSSAANKSVRDKLIAAGTRLDILKYPFPKLKDKMYIATSKDGRLRIYSWDMQDGGTMHDFDCVYQFQGKSGKVFTWTKPETAEGDFGSFYTDIFQLDASDGAIYLPVSTFIGSTSLAGQSISVVRIDGDKFVPDAKLIKTGSGLNNSISFSYDFFSVVGRPDRPVKLFTWDAAKQSFRFPVVIEDKKTPQGRVTDKFITYKFDGKYFVKVS